jgi:hypothetical protein
MSDVRGAGGHPAFMLPLGCKLERALPFQTVNVRNVRFHRTSRGCG